MLVLFEQPWLSRNCNVVGMLPYVKSEAQFRHNFMEEKNLDNNPDHGIIPMKPIP